MKAFIIGLAIVLTATAGSLVALAKFMEPLRDSIEVIHNSQ